MVSLMLRVLRNLTLSISPTSVALQGSAPPLATPGQFLRLDLVVVTCFQGSSLALPFFLEVLSISRLLHLP